MFGDPDPVAKHTHGRKQTCHNKRKCVDDPQFLAVVGGKIVSQPRQSGIQDSHVNADEKRAVETTINTSHLLLLSMIHLKSNG